MITSSAFRNGIWCILAFGIVASAATSIPDVREKQPLREASSPAGAPEEAVQAVQTSRGLVMTLDDGLFDKGRADLGPAAQRSIDRIVAFLGKYPGRRVQIDGFTDSEGASGYNLELSQSRADAVAMAIIRRGVDAKRVRATGYGELFPVAGNEPGSRLLNRRVEIIVGNDGHAIQSRLAANAP
jgi:outer membrane protein OmpA-like peptidoglycan-associated protein